jgi:hypothetical protein
MGVATGESAPGQTQACHGVGFGALAAAISRHYCRHHEHCRCGYRFTCCHSRKQSQSNINPQRNDFDVNSNEVDRRRPICCDDVLV